MKVLSLFSGVGGFDMGLEQAGWTTAFQCEIDSQCQRVLKHRWPDVPKWDDVSTLTGKHILEQTGGVDAVAWGSPCQDLSLAGKRAGLGGDKSSLFHEGIRIINELQELSDGKYPTISIWENVAGAFSSNNGRDFETVLRSLADSRCYHLEWSVLDAQFFGVPQRRRRVFVISVFNLGIAERISGQILAIDKGGSRRTSESKQQRQESSRRSQNSVGADSESVGMLFPALMDGNRTDDIRIWDDGVSPTLAAKMGTGGNNVPFVVDDQRPFFIDFAAMNQGMTALYDPVIEQRDVATCLPAANPHAVAQFKDVDATVDPTKPFFIDVAAMYQGPASTFEPIIDQRDVTTSLIATFPHSVAQFKDVADTLCSRDSKGTDSSAKNLVVQSDDLPYQDVVGTLCADDRKGVGNQYVNDDKLIIQRVENTGITIPIDIRNAIRDPQVTKSNTTGVGNDGDPSYTLTTAFVPAVAFAHNNGVDVQPSEHLVPTLTTNSQSHSVMSKLIVRRLTPRECERLMGWPDDHTRFAADGKEIADTHRYKMCGNGVASPVAQWIAEQINIVMDN